jgi:hypothetical protein
MNDSDGYLDEDHRSPAIPILRSHRELISHQASTPFFSAILIETMAFIGTGAKAQSGATAELRSAVAILPQGAHPGCRRHHGHALNRARCIAYRARSRNRTAGSTVSLYSYYRRPRWQPADGGRLRT